MRTRLKDISTRDLCDLMWDEVIPAWIGSSIGAGAIIFATFWRFVVHPPRLLIRYSDGETVWSFRGELIRQEFAPEVAMQSNIIWLSAVLFGLFCIWIGPRNWRAIRDELKRRRGEMPSPVNCQIVQETKS